MSIEKGSRSEEQDIEKGQERSYSDELKKKIQDLERMEKQFVPKWMEDDKEKNLERLRLEIEREKILAGKNIYVEARDNLREHSTELQNNVAEIQEAKLGASLRRLMHRTKDNPKIVNALNELLDGLSHQSYYGSSGEDLGPGRQKELAEFLEETAKALRWTVGGGNRPTRKSVPINLEKWNN